MRQLDRQDLLQMQPEQIAEALLQGRCNGLLGAPIPFDPDADRPADPPQLPDPETGTATEWREALGRLTEAEFKTASEAGLFPDWILGKGDAPTPDVPGIDQGAIGADRSSRTPLQARLAGMTGEEIRIATKEGRFDDLLAGTGPHS